MANEANAQHHPSAAGHTVVIADEGERGERNKWRAFCSCGWSDLPKPEDEADRSGAAHNASMLAAAPQVFFGQLAASIVTPHVGDQYRDAIKSILLRATEAGLYQEPK